MADINLSDLTVQWQKAFHEEDRLERTSGKAAVALSAFMISSLPTPLARKALVKEMWESGAEVIVSALGGTRPYEADT